MKIKFPILCLGNLLSTAVPQKRQPNSACPKRSVLRLRRTPFGEPGWDALSHLILAACHDSHIRVFSQAAYADPLDTAATYILT
jgi:hypothetical protein